MVGSMIVFSGTKTEVEEAIAADPYVKAGEKFPRFRNVSMDWCAGASTGIPREIHGIRTLFRRWESWLEL